MKNQESIPTFLNFSERFIRSAVTAAAVNEVHGYYISGNLGRS